MAQQRFTKGFICTNCGRVESKWLGRCPDCGLWNTFSEEVIGQSEKKSLVRATNKSHPIALGDVVISDDTRVSTGISELDRVLGGGVLKGSSTLLGGEPGIGKSTLMLQMLSLAKVKKTLYVSGEESPSNIKLRAKRLKLNVANITLFCDTELENILHQIEKLKPEVIVIDSLQTLLSQEVATIAGSVNQIRYCSSELADCARRLGSSLFLIGHVTKDGQLAGPKVVEHIVDTVLYFEQGDSGVRIVRATKNRFGTVDEIGIFLMSEKGLSAVNSPANFFIAEREDSILPPGIAFTAVVEGSRTFLVEIQALVMESKGVQSRIYSERIDVSRVQRVAAILERHSGLPLSRYDLYVHVAGGIRLTEVAIDLPLALALYSALTAKRLPQRFASFGELSLAGELRPVAYAERRIKGLEEMNFTSLMITKALRIPAKTSINIKQYSQIADAIDFVSKAN